MLFPGILHLKMHLAQVDENLGYDMFNHTQFITSILRSMYIKLVTATKSVLLYCDMNLTLIARILSETLIQVTFMLYISLLFHIFILSNTVQKH